MEEFSVTKSKIEVDGKYIENTIEVPKPNELSERYSDGTKIEDLKVTFKKKGDNFEIQFKIYNDSDKDVIEEGEIVGCASIGEYDCDSIIDMNAVCYKEESLDTEINAGDQLKKGGVIYCELTAKLKEEINDPNGVTVDLNASWYWKKHSINIECFYLV